MDTIPQLSLFDGKTCNKCLKFCYFSEFHRHRQMKDGFNPTCKTCRKALKNPITDANREKRNAYCREWRKKNKARRNQWERDYFAKPENMDRRRSNLQKLYAKSDHYQQYWRDYWTRNRVRKSEISKKWRQSNPETRKATYHRRRSRKYANGLHHGRKSIEMLFSMYPRKCMCCGATDDLTVDHIRPISKGGDGQIENLQILCGICNCRKGVKMTDYRQSGSLGP